MTILQSILMGIIQGLTEFLPISSSAHLVLVPHLLNWQIPADQAFVFNVLVQVATLFAVIIYFWKDLVQIILGVLAGIITRKPFETSSARLGWYILLATLPAGIIGLLIKDVIEKAFSSPSATAGFLVVTAVLLVFAEQIGKRQKEISQITWIDALTIGFAQAIAVFPGISRSGATITGGMTRNLQRPAAARFSFLISIPIMLAAGLLETIDLLNMPNAAQWIPIFIPGFIASAVAGYLSIRWLLHFLVSKPLYIFSAYCLMLGGFVLLFAR